MIGIIGGSGVYDLPGLEIREKAAVETPFGKPTSPLLIGTYQGQDVVFLARHGQGHQYLPHEVNYRANIWALKKKGVTNIVAISAVGSLREHLKPGDICIPNQYFDFIKGHREKTFFGKGLAAHVSTAEPTCPKITESLVQAGLDIGINMHINVTYGCVDGPRLGTRAESFFLRDAAGCDLVGMTNVPEVFLAREAQICYTTLAVVTDYDCWLDDPSQHVSVAQVIARFGESLEKAKKLLGHYLQGAGEVLEKSQTECSCRTSLETAILTPEAAYQKRHRQLLSVLKA